MMKKTYQQPQSTCINVQTEGMMATSPGLKDELGGDQLSNKQGGWDSAAWDEEDE